MSDKKLQQNVKAQRSEVGERTADAGGQEKVEGRPSSPSQKSFAGSADAGSCCRYSTKLPTQLLAGVQAQAAQLHHADLCFDSRLCANCSIAFPCQAMR